MTTQIRTKTRSSPRSQKFFIPKAEQAELYFKELESRGIDTKEYRDLYSFYTKIGSIRSPALDKDINFTIGGFLHQLYKFEHNGSNSSLKRIERSTRKQLQRLRLLKKASMLLETSTTFQEFEETSDAWAQLKLEDPDIKVRKEMACNLQYWGFVGVIGRSRLRVAVRKINDTAIHFWSVTPASIIKHYRDVSWFTQGDLSEE